MAASRKMLAQSSRRRQSSRIKLPYSTIYLRFHLQVLPKDYWPSRVGCWLIDNLHVLRKKHTSYDIFHRPSADGCVFRPTASISNIVQLDVCDKDSRFGSDLVRRAPSAPLLLNACLAVAARHLSKFGRCNSELADHYHEKAVQMLLAMLNEEDLDRHIETILPSTVILRLFEQLSCECSAGRTSCSSLKAV